MVQAVGEGPLTDPSTPSDDLPTTRGGRVPRVCIITRLATQNAGNEALSSLLLKFVTRRLPHAEVRVFDRAPARFQQFRLDRLGSSPEEIVRAFDLIARELSTRATPTGPLAVRARSDSVVLETTGRASTPWVTAVRHTIGFRRHLARLGLYQSSAYPEALNTIAWSDLVIWNPAGELHPSGNVDEALRLLLLVRTAQLLGRRTAIINHSLEVTHQGLTVLIRHVYGHTDFVAVREHGSYRTALALGLTPDKLAEIPDLAFLIAVPEMKTSWSSEHAFPSGAIALALNGREAHRGYDEWESLLSGLENFGRPLLFLSNALHVDRRFARQCAERHAVMIVDRQPASSELVALYARCAALITSRLHAAIFGLAAGVPVISIEPQMHKLTAIFDRLAYPLPTDSLHVPGWSQRIVNRTAQTLHDRARFVDSGAQDVLRQIHDIEASYARLFRLATSRGH
jgi:polysaccharide pyruvyl transferase WcaK-like protein